MDASSSAGFLINKRQKLVVYAPFEAVGVWASAPQSWLGVKDFGKSSTWNFLWSSNFLGHSDAHNSKGWKTKMSHACWICLNTVCDKWDYPLLMFWVCKPEVLPYSWVWVLCWDKTQSTRALHSREAWSFSAVEIRTAGCARDDAFPTMSFLR